MLYTSLKLNSMHFNKLKIQLKACAIHDVEDSLHLVLTYILMMMCEPCKRKRLDFSTSSGIKKSNKRTARIFQVNYIFNLYKKRRNILILTFLIIKFLIDKLLKTFQLSFINNIRSNILYSTKTPHDHIYVFLPVMRLEPPISCFQHSTQLVSSQL